MSGSALQGKAALVIWGDVKGSDIDEAALNEWWTNEHLPERMSIPGFLRARRYLFRDDSADQTYYLTLYETSDLATLTSPEYMEKLNNPTPGTQRHLPTLATMKRAACEVAHSQKRENFVSHITVTGATVCMVEWSRMEASVVAGLLDLVKRHMAEWFEMDSALMSCSFLIENVDATAPGSASQSYLNANLEPHADTTGNRCILLLEFSRSAAALFESPAGLKVAAQVLSAVQSQTDGQQPMSRIYAFLAGVGL